MDAEIRELTFQNVLDTIFNPAGVKVGGYPEEIFLDLTSDEIEQWCCSICFLIVKECQECCNKHFFCHTCIFAWSLTCGANSQRCPVCRCDQLTYTASGDVNTKLANKRVKCPTDDCSFRGPLKIFLLHSHGKQGFSNGHVDLDSLRPAARQSSRVPMPMVIGFHAADYSSDVRSQLQQGRMVIHQMMALLQLEMQLRQRALNSFSEALDTQTRMNRLDEVLALNEQLNEVGSILSGLMHIQRPRLALGEAEGNATAAPRLLERTPVATANQLIVYNITPPGVDDVSDSDDTSLTGSTPSPSPVNGPVPSSLRTLRDERHASGRLRLLSRLQMSTTGVTQGTSTADPPAPRGDRAIVEAEAPVARVALTRATLDRRDVSSTSGATVRAQLTSRTVGSDAALGESTAARRGRLTGGGANSATNDMANLSTPVVEEHNQLLRSVLAPSALRRGRLSDVGHRESDHLGAEDSSTHLRRARLPSIDGNMSLNVDSASDDEPDTDGSTTNISRGSSILQQAMSGLSGGDGQRQALSGRSWRIQTRQATPFAHSPQRRDDAPVTPDLRPTAAATTAAERPSSERDNPCVGIAPGPTPNVTVGRPSPTVRPSIDTNIFRQNRRSTRPRPNQRQCSPMERLSRNTGISSVAVARRDGQRLAAAGSSTIPAAHSRNLKPIRRKRPPLSIVSGATNQTPPTNSRSRRRSEIAQDIQQRQRTSDD